MLKFYISVIELLFLFSFVIGIDIAIMGRNKDLCHKCSAISMGLWTLCGLVGATTVVVLRNFYPQEMVQYSLYYNRWTLSWSMIFTMVSFVLLTIFLFYKNDNKKYRNTMLFLYESTSFIGLWLLGFSIVPQVYALTNQFVAFGEDTFGTTSLLRVGGYLLGLITIFLIGLSSNKVAMRLNEKMYKLYTWFIILAGLVNFTLIGVSALARLHVLSASNSLVFDFLVWEDDRTPYIVGLYTVITVVFSLILYLRSRHMTGTFKNNASRRLEKYRLQKNRRWSDALMFFVILILISVTAIKSYVYRPVQLSPPENYITQGENIVIPLKKIDDGHLHRFSYKTPEGNDIRFIAVKKPRSGSYGLGLDACDICGIAGYFERKDQIVCKRCDVVMNKSTIGFKGGCNPIPFKYTIQDGSIVIKKATLDKDKDRFPVGE